LDLICQSYLEGGTIENKVCSLAEAMKPHTWNEVLSVFEKMWPQVTVEASL
jgi:hypothetical protein